MSRKPICALTREEVDALMLCEARARMGQLDDSTFMILNKLYTVRIIREISRTFR